MTNDTTKTDDKSYSLISQKVLDKSRIEIQASIPSSFWEQFRNEAVKNINESVTIDGFRKGMVPENILIAKVGEAKIVEEMAELALSRVYLDILSQNKIDAIGRPQVQITKLAKGNPIEFKVISAVVPTINLPDYKKIANEINKSRSKGEIKVEEKEIEEAILKIRKSRVSHDKHDHEKMTAEEHEKAIMASLPELNDTFVQSLGDFKDVDDFKIKIKEMIVENKKEEEKEKTRIRIADAILEKINVELPEVMVESELNRTQAQFEADIENMGVKMEDYLKHSKKTLEDIRKDWLPHAEKKAKLQLALNAIADAEKIKPEPKEIEAEVNHILEHYKEADKSRAEAYATTVLTNEKVFQMLCE